MRSPRRLGWESCVVGMLRDGAGLVVWLVLEIGLFVLCLFFGLVVFGDCLECGGWRAVDCRG